MNDSKESSEGVGSVLGDVEQIGKSIEAEESRQFLDQLPVGILVSRLEGTSEALVYANAAASRLIRQNVESIKGASWNLLDAHRGEEDGERRLGAAIPGTDDFIGTFRVDHGDEHVLVDVYTGLIHGDDGEAAYRLAALVDVTSREEQNQALLENQLREKDLLLREIQHRVKNNLQLITSLIRLEARHAPEGLSPPQLEALAGRIEALQLLYQLLSNDEHTEEIDLGGYLAQVAGAVTRVHSVTGVTLQTSVDLCPVSVNIAMPVGLIVNELLTNAFKHAFSERGAEGTGTIALTCSCEDGERYRVVVSDDGRGLPEGMAWPDSGKLGSLIVQSLRENARARIEVDSAPGKGTRVSLTFEVADTR